MNPAARQRFGRTTSIRLTNLECGDELGESHKEEVQVKEKLELLVEHDGEKCEDVVLLVSYNVWRVSRLHPFYEHVKDSCGAVDLRLTWRMEGYRP